MKPLREVLSYRHLPALDGLRAVAVFVVIAYHAGLNGVPGDLGVTGFFVLSGFLITWLLLKENGRIGTIDLRAFYMRRSLRIFPAYFALVFLSLIVDHVVDDPWTFGRIVSALTYTLNYHNALYGHVGPLAHAWSLAIEEQFYLLWPAVFMALALRGCLRGGLVILVAGVVLWRSVLYLNGAPSHYVYNAFDTRFDSLAIGCLLAVLCTRLTFVSRCEWLARRAWYPFPILGALYISRVSLGPLWHYTVGFTVDSVLMAILLVQFLQLSSRRTWRWLDSRLAVWLGALSYPLYLWHIWGLDVGRKVPGGPASQMLVGIVTSIALASASYYGVERYFLHLKAGVGKRKSLPRETADSAEVMS